MAVPDSSKSLSLAGIRAELATNAYNATATTQAGLKDCSDGTVDTINTANATANRPDGSAPHAMSEFYSYDHDLVGLSMGNQLPQVFRYFSTPSPNNGQTVSTQSALGTVAFIANSSQSFSGTSTKKGNYTRTTSGINSNDLNTAVNNSSTNSWAIPTSGTLLNGYQYGITYYTSLWAHSSAQNLTVIGGTTQWVFIAAPTVTTQAATSLTGGFKLHGNLTGLGLGTNPASGAVHRVLKKGFVYSTTQTTPTYHNATIAQSSASPGVFNTGAYTSNISTSTSGTYYIRAFAYTEDQNTGPVSYHAYYAYGSTVQYTHSSVTSYASSLAGRTTDVCGFATNQTYHHDGSAAYPVVGDVCYTTAAATTFLASGFRKLGSGVKYRIDSNGVLGQISLC